MRALPHHCGVPAADELADLMKDAFAIDTFVQRASLHDDSHSQQDLLTDVLLQTDGREEVQVIAYFVIATDPANTCPAVSQVYTGADNIITYI